MSETDQKIEEAIEEKAEEIAAEKTEIAAAVVEASQQRIENAEAVAQQISDAVAMTELGRRVESLERDCISWREENAALKSQVSILETSLADLSAKLPPNLIAPMAEAPSPAPNNSPIRPASERTEVVLASNPEEAGEGQKGAETKAAKRKRFAL